MLERFPKGYDISPIKKIVESADVKLFNLENVLSDRHIYASSYCGGTFNDAARADEKGTKIIYDYLCDRCEQFGTDIEIKDQTIKVNFND